MKKGYCQFVYSLEKLVACFDFLFILCFHSITIYWVTHLCLASSMMSWRNGRIISDGPYPQKIYTLICIIYRGVL